MSIEVITYPDPIELLTDLFTAQLPSYGYTAIHVGNRIPNPRLTRFVRVDRVGGIEANLVTDSPLMIVEAWAGSVPAAHALLRTCRALVKALPGSAPGGYPVYRVREAGGPITEPDPTSDQPRATYRPQLFLRGFAA